MLSKELIKEIKVWCKEYEETNKSQFGSGLVEIHDSFEGNAYLLLGRVLDESEKGGE